MTRDKAIQELTCKLWGKDIPTDSRKLAELVLTLAEDIGMLQPTVELSSCGSFMLTKKLLDYSELDYECKWEEK